jgi:hypothetical protein
MDPFFGRVHATLEKLSCVDSMQKHQLREECERMESPTKEVPNKVDAPVKKVDAGDDKESVGPLERFRRENEMYEQTARQQIGKLDQDADKAMLARDPAKAIKLLEESVSIHGQAALPTDKAYVNRTMVLAKLLEHHSDPPQLAKAQRYQDKAVDALMSHRTSGSDYDALVILDKLVRKNPETRTQMDAHIKRLDKVVELIDRADDTSKLGKYCSGLIVGDYAQALIRNEFKISTKEQEKLLKEISGLSGFSGGSVEALTAVSLPRRTLELADKLCNRAEDLIGKDSTEGAEFRLKELQDLRAAQKKWRERPMHEWFK